MFFDACRGKGVRGSKSSGMGQKEERGAGSNLRGGGSVVMWRVSVAVVVRGISAGSAAR